jgi:hypothetical protein
MPFPPLRYAHVVKTTQRQRRVRVRPRVVYGTLAALQQVLAGCGWQSTTAFSERLHLGVRQHRAASGRRSSTLCKSADGLGQQLVLFHVYAPFVLPHASVRQPLLVAEPTYGMGSPTRWRPCTPAMRAGVTDDAWTLRAALRFRVLPWPQPPAAYAAGHEEAHGAEWPKCAYDQATRGERSPANPMQARMSD